MPTDAGPSLSPRLFLLDAPRAAARRLAARFDGELRVLGKDWNPLELGDPAPGANDLIVLWGDYQESATLARVSALHAHHPRVPLVARQPRDRSVDGPRLLAAGVHELLRSAADLPRAQAHARARTEQLGESAGRASRERAASGYEGLFPNLYDWIYVIGVAEDGALRFETVNPPLQAADGFLDPDFVGRAPEACLEPGSAERMTAHLRRVLDEGCPLRFEEEQPVGGRRRNFQTILTPVRNKWGRIHRIAGISRDITALVEAQVALRQSEERLAHALEGTQQGLWDWDLAHGVVYRSPRWFEMLGLEARTVAETLEAGLAQIHPDDLPAVEQAIRLHLDGHLPRFQAEYRIRTGSGDWLWLFDVGRAVGWSDEGRPARIAGLCTDITERRRAEESLRALVGGVVHEMRNPAFGIGVNLDALEATFGEDPRTRPFVAALRESCQRILNLMNDLRDYGEPRTLRAEPCLVRALVEEAVRSCSALAGERHCRVRLAFEDERLVLPLHALRMHQVFRNLLENALLHAPVASEVTVTSRTARRGERAWSELTVEDDGPGFDSEALARAFEPFFTRRPGGTGLGLSIVRRVVEEHGGSVDATNRPEGGARLTLRLPQPARQVAPERKPDA